MKRFLSCSLTAFSLTLSAHGAAVVVQADDDNGFSSSNGTDLVQGNLVRVGYFDITDSVIQQNALNIAFLDSHFFEFGIAHIGDTYGVNGHLSSNVTRNTTGGSSFDNKQIVLWVFSTLGASASDTFSTAVTKGISEHGIFYADMLLVPTWRIRSQSDMPNTTTIDISDLTNSGTGGVNENLTSAAHVVVGGFASNGAASDLTGAKNFTLAVVPEPSTAGLAIFGGLALLGRRRRLS